jgi:hypothetical protein
MTTVPRIIITLALLGVTAFCVFGLLASFEPGVSLAWRVGYATAIVACLVGLVWTWARASRSAS